MKLRVTGEAEKKPEPPACVAVMEQTPMPVSRIVSFNGTQTEGALAVYARGKPEVDEAKV